MTKFISKFMKEVKWSKFVKSTYVDKLIAYHVTDTNFRILKIANYTSKGKELTDVLSNVQVRKLFVNSSNLFFLIIDGLGDDDFNLTKFESVVVDIFEKSGKSFLIELCYSSTKVVRYIFRNETLELLSDEKLFRVFDAQLFNDVRNKSLVQCGLEWKIVENLLKNENFKGEPIVIRLIKTFNTPCNEELDKQFLKTLVVQSNLPALRAYLDLSIIDDGLSIPQTLRTTTAISYEYDTRGKQTLLFYAASAPAGLDVLKLLLRLGADVHVENSGNYSASDYAPINSENLKLLLENDARFPFKFYETYNNSIKCGTGFINKEIQKINKEREDFHAAIAAKNTKEIKEFRKKFPLLRLAYTFTEEPRYSKAATLTAIETAIRTGDTTYSTYFLLRDEGFGINEADLDYMGMQDASKNRINALTLSRLKWDQSSHITFLLSKTKIFGVKKGKHEKYMQKMKKIYDNLDKLEEVTNLLKLLEHSKSLTIIIDFQNRKIGSIDLNAIRKGMDGVTYHFLGRIYIGAADKSDEQIAGFLIHELTHFALHIVFNNTCKPYYKSDAINEKIFKETIAEAKKEKDNHEVVNNVFKSYGVSSYPKELIVTVTQLIALGEKLLLVAKFSDLFGFFNFNVLPIVNNLAAHPEQFLIKREVQQVNDFLGHSEGIENWNIWPQSSKLPPEIRYGTADDIQLVVCDTPKLFLADFYKSKVKADLIFSPGKIQNDDGYLKSYFILASVEDFKCLSKWDYMKRIWNLHSDIKLILNCDKFDELEANIREKLVKYFDNDGTSNNLVAFASQERTLRSMFNRKKVCFRLVYEWNDLEQSSKTKLLSTDILFQGINVKLNKLIDHQFAAIPMKKLINGEEILIEASTVLVDNYDEVKFVDRGFTAYRNLDQVLLTARNGTSSFLLSGEGGTGKSTIISRITLKLKDRMWCPLFWVIRINLHEHLAAFEDKSIVDPDIDPLDVIFNYFVKVKEPTERDFQYELFHKLYNESQVILLMDAVDEIAPKFFDQVSTLIQKLSGRIQLWVTTRPHLKDELKKKMSDKIVLEFSEFTRRDQLKCATNFWKKELNVSDPVSVRKLEVCAERILSLFADSINQFISTTIIGAPLLTSMIAEIYLKHVQDYVSSSVETDATAVLPDYIDIYDLFKEFVAKKLLIVSKEKGILVAAERADNLILSHDVIALFERFALRFIFKPDKSPTKYYVYHDAQFQDRTLMIDMHNIQRCGLVLFSSNSEPYFIHKTFAEFFVSNFIVKSLMKASYSSKSIEHKMLTIAMDILCKNVISREEEHFTLMKFIDGGMKYLWHERNESETFYGARKVFTNVDFVSENSSSGENLAPSVEESSSVEDLDIDTVPTRHQFRFSDLDYVLHEKAIVLLRFFLQCLIPPFYVGRNRYRIFDDCVVFWRASDMSVRCIVEYICQGDPVTWRPPFLYTNVEPFTPPQLAFMHFPQNRLDVLRDITSFEELKEALTKNDVFDEFLQKETTEKYERSTLKLFVNLMNIEVEEIRDEEDSEIDRLMYQFEKPNLDFDYNISEELFDDFIEMKWMAMIDWGFPIDDWTKLVNKTIFKNIIFIIFNEFNNNIVLRFFEWAKSKASVDIEAFTSFVANTFMKYIWNCTSENGVEEIFNFIRNDAGVDIKKLLQQPIDDEFNETFEAYLSFGRISNFVKNFPICRKYFTDEEFDTFLFKELDEGKVITKILACGETVIIESVLLTISPLSANEEFISKIKADVNSDMLFDLLKYLVGFSRLNIVSIKRVIECIERVSCPEHMRAALQRSFDEKTLFHVAAERRDLQMLQIIWNLSRTRFINDELEVLLLAEDVDNFSIIQNKTKDFLVHPPSILNTNCRTAAYEFVAFEFGKPIPAMAIRLNEKTDRICTYIGRCLDFNTNSCELCKIIPSAKGDHRIEIIGYDENLATKSTGSFDVEILVGKGLKWICEKRQFPQYFKFKEHHLMKNEQDQLSLEEVTRVGECYLAYDDDALLDDETEFIYWNKKQSE